MSVFELALQAATALGSEYVRLDARISGLAVAADHDPNFNAEDEALFQTLLGRRSALAHELTARFEWFERHHRETWRAFLVESANRLHVLAESNDGERFVAAGALYNWAPLSRAEADIFDAPGGFAKGVAVLASRRHAIDELLRAGR